jgi:hypothetical protein
MLVTNKECASIIVQAYEAEDYLATRLESRISQTHLNVEISCCLQKVTTRSTAESVQRSCQNYRAEWKCKDEFI